MLLVSVSLLLDELGVSESDEPGELASLFMAGKCCSGRASFVAFHSVIMFLQEAQLRSHVPRQSCAVP